MIRRLYEWRLRRGLNNLPGHICFMLSDMDMAAAPHKLYEIVTWCTELGISSLTFHIRTDDPLVIDPYIPAIRAISEIAHLTILSDEKSENAGKGMEVQVAVGMGGRDEIAGCIRSMAADEVLPEDVDESVISSYLTFKCEPDLVIKTGGSNLTDFLIWQSVYSELFFSDVNWAYFRKVDFLRALRDYQFRKRRFGK